MSPSYRRTQAYIRSIGWGISFPIAGSVTRRNRKAKTKAITAPIIKWRVASLGQDNSSPKKPFINPMTTAPTSEQGNTQIIVHFKSIKKIPIGVPQNLLATHWMMRTPTKIHKVAYAVASKLSENKMNHTIPHLMAYSQVGPLALHKNDSVATRLRLGVSCMTPQIYTQ